MEKFIRNADEFKINPTICALHGGEDYELLITISQEDYENVGHQSAIQTRLRMIVFAVH